MIKQELAHIAKVMYDLQEYCRYIDELNNHEECNGCTFLFDHVKCKLIALTKDNKIPCDNWQITKADIERLEQKEQMYCKKRGYRFWVCKKGNMLNEYIPVANSFPTLNDANTWMLKHGCSTKETLYAIKAPIDMYGYEDIERLERESNAD